MSDSDTAAEKQQEAECLAARRLHIALRMHESLVAYYATVNAANIAKGLAVVDHGADIHVQAVERANALLKELCA